MESLSGRLQELAKAHGDKDALADEATSLSYSSLLDHVLSAAADLKAQGIVPGRMVGLMVGDELVHMVALLALIVAGARTITLATFDPAILRETLADRVGATALVVADAAKGPFGFSVSGRATTTEGPAEGSAGGTVFLRTSGTTGDMNITEVSVQQLMLQNLANPDYSPERLMCPASIEHNNSKRHRLYALLAGATNVFRPQRDHDLVESALRQGVTCLDVTPMHAAGLVARADAGRLGGIKVRVSGSSMSADLREGVLSRVTRNLEVRYGATECGTIAIAQVRSGDAETVGLPAPGVRFEIVDDSGRVLPTGEIGSIRIRTQGMSLGYYDNPRQTAHRFRDGWFWPGDVGRLLEDGRLVIEGRADDMMILNGVNIFPAEIERVLERHPAVAAAAAVAMSSRVHGQIPVAAVELRDGTTATEAELRVFARERLALRSPRRVMILPSLPRNDQGKILRRKIADAFY